MRMPGSFVLGPTSDGVGGEEVGGGAGHPRADGRDTQGSPSEAAAKMLAAAETAGTSAAGTAEFGNNNNVSLRKPIAECPTDRGDGEAKWSVVSPSSGGSRLGGTCTSTRNGNALTAALAGQPRRRPRTVSASSPQVPAERPAASASTGQDQDPHQAHLQEDPALHNHNHNHHHNPTSLHHRATIATIPILHQNLDAAHERLAALLRREERAQDPQVQGHGGDGGGSLWLSGCHVAKPRFLVRKRGASCASGAGGDGAGGGAAGIDGSAKRDDGRETGTPNAAMADGAAEGRQPAEEFDPRKQVGRGSGGSSTVGTCSGTDGSGIHVGSTGGDDGEAILRQLLLRVGDDEEVVEERLSDVGWVYRHAGLDRNGQVVRHLHRLAAGVFGESDEIVEIAMSYLDRYLMAKADPTSLTYTPNPAILAGATNANTFLDSTSTLTPDWSIVYASLACLQIAIKTHSPHGDRLSLHRPAQKFFSSQYWDALDRHRRDGDPHVLDKWRVPMEARMVADLEALGAQSGGGDEIRNVLVRIEADILHTLEFRLVPTTGWGVARDLMDIVENSVQIERLAYERFRQQQAARMAEDAGAMQEDMDYAEEDKAHRLAGPAATTLPSPYPIRIDSSRLTNLTNCQLSAALYDNDLLSIPRSILARAAVQNAVVRLNEESKAAHGLAGTSTAAEVQVQYEAGCAIVGRLAGALRGACSIPYGEAADMDWDSTKEEYEKESMFQFAVQSLGKHLSHILQQEAKNMAAQNEAAAQREAHGTSHVVTPSSRSKKDLRPGNDKEYVTMKMDEAEKAKSNGGTSTADSALAFASERHHRAKKARKVKKTGIGQLLSGYSPGCGKSGRVILE